MALLGIVVVAKLFVKGERFLTNTRQWSAVWCGEYIVGPGALCVVREMPGHSRPHFLIAVSGRPYVGLVAVSWRTSENK